jgi:hypothetical protein
MRNTTRRTRENRTITVDFRSEAAYFQLLGDRKAFLECVLAFVMSLGFQLKHKATCRGGGCLTRHSHYVRVRLGGVTIWRLQCTTCRAVFTILPHFVLRYRQMRPEVARDALLATHGGLSLELCAVLYHISPMALYRLVCALGQQSLVCVLTRCGLPLPIYVLADEKHSRCLTDRVYLPTIVSGRVLWHLGYSESKSAAAFTASYGDFQRAALQVEPSYRVRGALTDGFDSTTQSLRTLFPEARLGYCLRHALNKLPQTGRRVSSSTQRFALEVPHPPAPVSPAHQPAGSSAGPAAPPLCRLHRYHVGAGHGERVRNWFQDKKVGWYTVLADPRMPASSTLLDQAHNAMDRKLFAMKGFHHPGGSQVAFLTGLAHLYNLIPYQRRALHTGQCGVEVEGGRLPTQDWMLNLQILTSGGFR